MNRVIYKFYKMYNFFGCFFLCIATQALAQEGVEFSNWLNALKQSALQQNISSTAIEKTLAHAAYLPDVIVLDRAQPEFISPFLTYLGRRVTPEKIAKGRAMMTQHAALLTQVSAQYGVPPAILVSFWGLETNYGKNKGHYDLASTLMTLAYEGRRADFFRTQLIDAMRIVDAGHQRADKLIGSWAGATGHLQFMPSTFLTYGVDANIDGRIDVWGSLDDAFASAANYLSRIGWQQNQPVALEVRLPADFDYQQAQLAIRQSSEKWTEAGVVQADGTSLPAFEHVAIILPQGWQGPAFAVGDNFDVIMQWNRSVNYALAVSYLALQLQADKPLLTGHDAPTEAISFNQIWALQAKLNALGFDSGAPDGFPGLKTQAAIRSYQLAHQLHADGYASTQLLKQVLQEGSSDNPSAILEQPSDIK